MKVKNGILFIHSSDFDHIIDRGFEEYGLENGAVSPFERFKKGLKAEINSHGIHGKIKAVIIEIT